MSEFARNWLRIYGAGESGELSPLPVSLENATDRLRELPRMFLEPDGSFLWNAGMWQLEGTLYDDGRILRYVELRGACPLHAWEIFLSALGASFQSVTLEQLDTGQIVPGTWLLDHL